MQCPQCRYENSQTARFCEECGTRLMRGAAVSLTRPLTEVQIPPTVQGVLAARIDRLSTEEKALLQTLAEIYGWFTEGFETGDLKEARALLEEMS